ncbi:MAG: hypothetical protein M3R55_17500 [Acidobacteriota bacterium]|nr:hypothetical protein [Acidobacteriota bacterium]
MTVLIALTLTSLVAAPPPATSRGTLVSQALTLASRPPASTKGAMPGGDSIVDGGIKGAVIGLMAGAVIAYTVCRVIDESQGESDCAPVAAKVGGVFAAVGLAAGTGIDALLVRAPDHRVAPLARVRLRF